MNSQFRLTPINEILNGALQPWQTTWDNDSEHYRDLLRLIPEIPWPVALGYQLNYKSYLLFSPRIHYYARLTDNAVASHLREAFDLIGNEGSEALTLYIVKLTREAVTTLIHDAVDYCQRLDIRADALTDFISNKSQKECLVILHYIIASLARCYMEIQQRYMPLLDAFETFADVESFYASVAGWTDAPLVNVIALKDPSTEKSKKFQYPYCSFLYVNNDPEEWNISMTSFYNKLVSYQQIPADTDQNALLNTFRGIRTYAVITWIGKPATLKAIIDQLVNKKKKIVTYPDSVTHWQVVSSRFQLPDGTMMPNLSSETPRKGDAEMVKDIVSALY